MSPIGKQKILLSTHRTLSNERAVRLDEYNLLKVERKSFALLLEMRSRVMRVIFVWLFLWNIWWC